MNGRRCIDDTRPVRGVNLDQFLLPDGNQRSPYSQSLQWAALLKVTEKLMTRRWADSESHHVTGSWLQRSRPLNRDLFQSAGTIPKSDVTSEKEGHLIRSFRIESCPALLCLYVTSVTVERKEGHAYRAACRDETAQRQRWHWSHDGVFVTNFVMKYTICWKGRGKCIQVFLSFW